MQIRHIIKQPDFATYIIDYIAKDSLMEFSELLSVCISAFVVVFIILTALALFMRLIIILFLDKQRDDDKAVFAVIASVMNRIYPGAKITKIEEVK
jgi:predicted permease